MVYYTRFEIDKTEECIRDENGKIIPGIKRISSRAQQWITKELYDTLPEEEKAKYIEDFRGNIN